jgi:subtilisin-like proprotein convertase family protein
MLNSAPAKISSQQAAPSVAKSSLQLGPAFDTAAQQNFESGLNNVERASLVRLQSRFFLADPSRPLPTLDPVQPFYLTLSSDMTTAFKADLEAAGASVIAYVYLHTYVIRARDAASLAAVGEVLASSEQVLGTATKLEMDQCSAEVWSLLESADAATHALRVMFWSDIAPVDAQALLDVNACPVLLASRDESGALNLETPYVDVSADLDAAWHLSRSSMVARVELTPTLVLHNQNSVALAKANLVTGSPYNLNGTGEIVGVWDGGPPQLHNDYGGRVTIVETGTAQQHATHVFGTILGSGAGNSSAKGFAPAATGFSYNFNGDIPGERRTRRHTSLHCVDNHSYGNGATSSSSYGGYDSSASTVDVDNRDLLMIMCKSAGNDGSGTTTITNDSCIKNGFCVASTADNGTISSFSSRGPANDGRLLPTISANGEALTSTLPTNVYGSMSGTSMSSPSTTGSMVLLAQLWRANHNKMTFSPDVARAVVCQTSVDAGIAGPDYQYGFGIIDVKAAADLILADKTTNGKQILRGISRPASVSEWPVDVTSSATPFKVTLSWLDTQPSGTATVKLVNDLDLELVEPNGTTIHFPYSGLTSGGSQTTVFTQTTANRRDNIEQAIVTNPTVGTWKIRVRGFSLPDPTTPIGFVVASNRPASRDGVIYEDAVNLGTPVAIPDNAATGIARTFNVTQTKIVRQVRVYCTSLHTARGNLSIKLKHPDNTEVLLEGADTSARDDIIGIFPDTRKYNDDVTSLYGKAANGTWTVTVADNNSGETGTINWLALEIEFDPPGTPVNNPPNANASSDFNVQEGVAGQLIGSASSDPDGDTLTYAWAQISPASPAITLTGANTATPTFTAPAVTANTAFTFRLTCNDGKGGIDTDDVVVTVLDTTAPNNPPTANAGPDAQANESTTVNLSGAGSTDPDGDALSFAWTQIAGSPTLTLTGASTATPSFTAPSVAVDTNYTFRLTVNDGRGGSDTDDVVITVRDTSAPNIPPVADAGADQVAAPGVMVTLNGSGSTDANGDPLSYTWLQTGGVTTVTLSGSGSTVTFTAPSAADVLTFQLTVDDGRGGVDVDTITITVQSGSTGGGGGGKGGGDGGCTSSENQTPLLILLSALGLALVAWRTRRPARS